MYDAVIIGASLAGAATAIHLAERGRSVVIVERHRIYKRKACGEGLFPLGVAELDGLGLLEGLSGASRPLNGLRFHAGGQRAVADMGAGGGGIGVQRSVLDPALLARARAAGVEIRSGVSARSLLVEERLAAGIQTDKGEIRARVVIAADGLNSRFRRLAGLEHHTRSDRFGVTAHLRVPLQPDPFVDIFVGDAFELYLTPVGDHLLNAGVLTRRERMRTFAGNLKDGYTALLRAHPALAAGFELVDEPVAAGPFSARATRAFRANVLLVGDAAGFFDGITGEGMSTALASARSCAGAVDAYLAGGGFAPLRRYDRERHSLVRNTNLIGRISLAFAGHHRLARSSVRNLGRQPATFRRLAAISSGEAGLCSLRPRDLPALTLGI